LTVPKHLGWFFLGEIGSSHPLQLSVPLWTAKYSSLRTISFRDLPFHTMVIGDQGEHLDFQE
jgi:hypothetical protein